MKDKIQRMIAISGDGELKEMGEGGQWWKNITLLESADNNNNLWSWIPLTPF